MGKAADPYSDYFDRCRRKRNVIDYDDAFVATETEALEVLAKAKEFVDIAERWIGKNHPNLENIGDRLLALAGTQLPLGCEPHALSSRVIRNFNSDGSSVFC